MMKISWAELSAKRVLCGCRERNFVLATNEQSNDDLKSFSFSNFFTHTSWKSSAQPTMLSSLSPVARNLRHGTVSQWVTAKGKAKSDRERLMDFRGVPWEFQEFSLLSFGLFQKLLGVLPSWCCSASVENHSLTWFMLNPNPWNWNKSISVDTTTLTFHR